MGRISPGYIFFFLLSVIPAREGILLTVKTFHYISGAYPLHNGFGKMISMI